MGNNIRELRLAFLLTPRELAALMGTYPQQVRRLEESGGRLNDEWIDAVAEALRIPRAAVTDPDADIPAVVAAAEAPAPRLYRTCPIAARFAVQAMVARLAGMTLALSLTEDDLAIAVRNLVAFIDEPEGDNAEIEGAEPAEQARANRLSQGLQIVVVAILQARRISLDPRQIQAVTLADRGASSLIRWFSLIDQSDF